ncbi:MAG: 4-hydroxythreonine-4-phosphate dehydrogenase PdxA, partial [Sporomusa sp.]
MKPILGIMLGEATGIGPELVAKLVAGDRLRPYCRPLLIGDARVLKLGQKIAATDFDFSTVERAAQVDWSGPISIIDLKNHDPANLVLGKNNSDSGRITYENLLTCLELLKSKDIEGLVFAPLNKEAMKRGGCEFEDEHRLFAHYLQWDQPFGELNVLNKLWTSRVTSHIPLASVAKQLSASNVLRAIRLIDQTLKRAGYPRPTIGVAAINPHAGEGGLCGREELDIIAPAID